MMAHSYCDHIDSTIDDFQTGDTVCTSCGLCIGQLFLPSFEEEKKVSFNVRKDHISADVLDLICTVSDKFHVCDQMRSRAIQIAQSLDISMRRRSAAIIAGYAIYNTFLENNCPRSFNEISAILCIKSSEIWKLCKMKNNNFVVKTLPSELSARMLSSLNLSYSSQKIISKMADFLQQNDDSFPNIILGVATLFYFKHPYLFPVVQQQQQQQQQHKEYPPNLMEISFACDTSPSALKRCNKRIGRYLNEEMIGAALSK